MARDIMPIDIVNQKFRQALRGYIQQDVDDFMGKAADAYGKALEETDRLKHQLETAERELRVYREAEETIKSALVLAERSAGEARSRAQEQASLIVREAEQQARETLAGARREAEHIARELQDLRHQRCRFEAEFRALLGTYMHLLSSTATDPPPAPAEPVREQSC